MGTLSPDEKDYIPESEWPKGAQHRSKEQVVEAMGPFFTESYFNPSSMYEPETSVSRPERAPAAMVGGCGAAMTTV